MENPTLILIFGGSDTISGFNCTSPSTLTTTTSLRAAVIARFQISKYVLYVIILTISIVSNTAVVHIIRTQKKVDHLWRHYSHHQHPDRLGFWRIRLQVDFWANLLQDTLASTDNVLHFNILNANYDLLRQISSNRASFQGPKDHENSHQALHLCNSFHIMCVDDILRWCAEVGRKWLPWELACSRLELQKLYSLVLFLVQYGIPLTLTVTLHSLALRTLRGTSSYMKPQRNGIQRIERSQSELSAMNLLGRKRSKTFKSRRCLLWQ